MKFLVVGSGPSGVHFAQTVLDQGHEVVMLDVGRERTAPVLPDSTFDEIKQQLPNPVEYLLGDDFQGVTLPGAGEYYGLPPSKRFVLEPHPEGAIRETGFASLSSFARGGLAEAWTAGVYPFTAAELADFPFAYADLLPHYEEVARRIGVSGVVDDLAPFFPGHAHLMEPLRLDTHSARLLSSYQRQRERLNADGCFVGRSRLAVLTRDHEGRGACSYLGRCLWGCPREALYTPSLTLARLMAQAAFRYVPDHWVSHCTWDHARHVTGVVVRGRAGEEPIRADAVVLAAGTLSSARIVLESVRRNTGEVLVLPGLMDNQQLLVPFVNLGMMGRRPEPRNYQYHQVCVGIGGDDPRHYVHAQLTTLKTGVAHPVIESLPFDMATSTRVFRLLRSALGVANVNLHDTRRADCTATLERHGDAWRLALRYVPARDDARQIERALTRIRMVLRRLGCVVPPGMAHVRPKGASVHYAGLVPMGSSGGPLGASAEGKSREVEGLYFADGITFPFLPAKNITFTLMANAVRIARAL